METVDLAFTGGPLRVHVAGSGSPVVLVHGAMLDSARFVWRHTAPALARSFRVFAVDLPRHGASRPWQGALDAARMDAILAEALDRLGLRTAALVGFSMGASIALQFAVDHPGRVDALVLVAPGGLGAHRRGHFATWLTAATPAIQRAALHRVARDPGVALHRILHAGEHTPEYPTLLALQREEAHAKRQHRELLFDDRQRLAYGPLRMRLDLLPRVAELQVPTLWVRGAADRVIRDNEIAAAARRSGSELVRIPDAGHLAPLDQPERFNAVVSHFLASASRGGMTST